MYMVLGEMLCDLDPKVKGQVMHFPVNASSQSLDVATSKFAGA